MFSLRPRPLFLLILLFSLGGAPFARGAALPPAEGQGKGYRHKQLFGLTLPHLPGNTGDCGKCHKIHFPKGQPHLKEQGGNTCFICHAPFPGTRVHRPVEEGRCPACHQAHSSLNQNLLAIPGNGLCLGCHPPGKIPSHPPGALSLQCLDCHSPHAANTRRLTRNLSSLGQCLLCHGNLLAGKVLHQPAVKGRCPECHNPHSDPPVPLKPCTSCHADLAGKKVVHMALEKGCRVCHEAHASPFPRLLAGPPDSLCSGSCHPDKAGGRHAGGVRPRPCLECHGPHSTDLPRLVREGMTGVPCLECHEKFQDRPVVHTPLRSGGCPDCHDPHALPPVKTKGCPECHRREIQAPRLHAPVKEGCGKCHETHAGAHSFQLVSPVPGLCLACHGTERARRHRDQTAPRPCGACHDPHGSEKAGLIRPGLEGLSCQDCHGSFQEEPVVHPPAAAGRCPDCHDPHAVPPKPTIPCGECHEDLVRKAQSLHDPVGKGACKSCHDNHASAFSFQLISPPGELCQTCHRDESRHGTLTMDGPCLRCHLSHRSDLPDLLGPGLSRRSCPSCHPGRSEGKVVHTPVKGGECRTCHDPHAGPPPPPAPCLGCHPGVRVGGNIHAPSASGDRGCLRCHAAHSSENPFFLLTAVPSLCLGCHPEKAEGLHGRARLGEDCLGCHAPHSGALPKRLKRKGWTDCEACHREKKAGPLLHGALRKFTCGYCHDPHGNPPLRDPLPCRDCHREALQGRLLHASLRDDKCLDCHEVHGGAALLKPVKDLSGPSCLACHEEIGRYLNAGLSRHKPVGEGCGPCHTGHEGTGPYLRGAFFLDYEADFSEKGYALCFGCHPPSLAGPAASESLFRDGDRNLHWLHLQGRSGRGFSCWVCHDAHAGSMKALLNAFPPFNPGRQLGLRFVPDEGGGTCESACHERRGYSR